jgi:Helix-turn-helix domain
MSRKVKGRVETPFVPLTVSVMRTAAWKSLTPYARLVYIALKGNWNNTFNNNGRIFLSLRRASKELGFHKDTIGKALHELEYYGFIVMTRGAYLGVEGKGKAPHWRLTELAWFENKEERFPTRDYDRWDGVLYDPKKNKTLSGPVGRGVRSCRTLVSGPIGHLTPEVSGPVGHKNAKKCPTRQDISSSTILGGVGGSGKAGRLQ